MKACEAHQSRPQFAGKDIFLQRRSDCNTEQIGNLRGGRLEVCATRLGRC
jgi:hypothetical protein